MRHKRFYPTSRRKKAYSLFALMQVFALIFSSLLMAMPVAAAPAAVPPTANPEAAPLQGAPIEAVGRQLAASDGQSLYQLSGEYVHQASHTEGVEWHGSTEDAPIVADFGGGSPDGKIAGLDSWLQAQQGDGSLQAAGMAAMAAAPVVGTKKVVVLRVYFNDYANTSRYTQAEVQGMFDELDQLWQDTSYGKINIQHEVSTLFQLPDNRSAYIDDFGTGDLSNGGKYYKVLGDAVANSPASVDWNDVDAVMVVMAETGNQFHRGQANKCTQQMGPGGPNKLVGCAIFSENPSESDRQVWGRWAHEMGHSFQEAGPAHPSNYNSEFELMDSNYPGQSGVFEKQDHMGFPGWLPPSKYVNISNENGGETICLYAMEYDPADKPNPQAIRAEITGNLYYMISVRRAVLGDDLNGDFNPTGIPDEGILIERVEEGADQWVTVQGNPGRNQLWDVGGLYENETDGIFIEVFERSDNGDDFCVNVRFDKRGNQPDVMLNPWRSAPGDTWETTDIWIDSPVNGFDTYRYGMWNDLSGNLVPRGNGDDPAVGMANRVYARVRNIGNQPASDVVVNWEVTDPLGVGIAGSNGWASIGSTDSTSFPGLAVINPGDFVDVWVEWTPNIELTEEQIEAGIFNFHSCLRVTLNPVAGETVLGNQDGDREQENISYFQAVPDEGDAGIYKDVIKLRNDDLVESKFFFLSYENDTPEKWLVEVNGGEMGVEVPPGEVYEIPVVIEPVGEAVVGSVFGVDVQASSLKELVSDMDVDDVHHEFDPLGGVRVEARVLMRPKVECSAEDHGETLVNGKMEGHEEFANERVPLNVLIQGVDTKRNYLPEAMQVARVQPDGTFEGVVYSDTKITEVICLFAGTTELASASSGYVPVAPPVTVTPITVTPIVTITPTVTVTPEPRSGHIAYVLDSDTASAAAFADLLNNDGYTVDLIPLPSVANTDFAQYDLVIIGSDTGSLGSWGGADGAKLLRIIEAGGTPILGNGEGGYAYHGRLGLNIGWGNGWHGSKTGVMGDASLNYYHAPYDLSGLLGAELSLYTKTGHIGIHVPKPIPGVTTIGLEPNDATHYPLVAEKVSTSTRVGDRCYELWGFTGNPTAMKRAGQKLYINAVEDTMNACGGPVETRPTPIVTLTPITPTPIVTPTPFPTFELPETTPPPLPLNNTKERTQVEIVESTNKRFSASFKLPEVQLQTVKDDEGNAYTQMLLPGVEPNSSGLPGQPDVPMARYLLAVPHGAEARVEKFDFSIAERFETILYPAQPEAADAVRTQPEEDEPIPVEDFMDLPFEFDREAYATDRNFPENPVQVTRIGQMRDLDIVQVTIAAGQYNPAKNLLVLFENVEAHIAFEGGDGGFLPAHQLDNPFEQDALAMYTGVLNKAVLVEYPWKDPVFAPNCIGHEYLIITDPDFRAAADDLRAWKINRGLSTRVIETGNGAGQAGTTADEIKETIKWRYDNCLVRPSYVLLLGDAEFIPPFYRPTHYGDLAGTDLNYSLMGSDEFFPTPDMAMGRIPVDTLDQAQTVIDKIISYEQSPPNNSNFYNNKTVASYFQCCRNVANDGTTSRSFIETSELVRDELLSEGFNVERIYKSSTSYHSDYTGDTTPNRYYNGALLPADLRASSGYAWDGGSQDVIDAINEGTSLVLHRDHGGISGWGSPSFGSSHLSSLTNGTLTPVVYSINCASGLFDNETRNPADDYYSYGTSVNGTYWAERMLRMEGGAVGIIGDTRNSPTWANSALARGLIDATWPDTVPSYGNDTSIRRLGDIMNYGKMYMIGQIVQPQTAGSVEYNAAITDMVLYHVYGDPSMKMWAKNPWQVVLPGYIKDLTLAERGWVFPYSVEGVTITALLDGEPVGRGKVVNGEAVVQFVDGVDKEVAEKELVFSASHPDAASTVLQEADGTGEVTPEGGRWEWAEQNFAINFPKASLQFSVTVLFDELSDDEIAAEPSVAKVTPLDVFTLDALDDAGAEVTKFDKEYSFELLYTDDELAEKGAKPDHLQCVYFDEEKNEWVPMTTEVNPDEHKVTCRADHFTLFALVADTEGQFELEPVVIGPTDEPTKIFLPFTTK